MHLARAGDSCFAGWMRSPRNSAAAVRRENGSVIILILVVLAALGAGWYLLRSSRDKTQKGGRAFADEVAQRVVLQRDTKFLARALSQKAQMQYPPSFQMRLMDYVREPGVPSPQYKMKGEVLFTDQFFDPNGTFIAEFAYPTGPAFFEIHISHPAALWQIDDINWTWQRPTPTPTPTPSATPTPTPSPTPAKKKRQ